jgi:hypothetical protein
MFVENSKVARDPGLADGERRNQRAYRPFATPQLLDDAESGRVRQNFESESRSGHGLPISINIYKQ